jgi:hypothetical protein
MNYECMNVFNVFFMNEFFYRFAESSVRVHVRAGGRAAVRDQMVPGQLRNLPIHPQRRSPHQDFLSRGIQHQRKYFEKVFHSDACSR